MVFAKQGDSQQQFGGSCPLDWIEMASPRPDGDGWVAGENGEWIIPTPTMNDKLNKALAAYNADVELFSSQLSGALLADGANMDSHIASVRAAYIQRRSAYLAEKSAILAGG